MPDAECAREGLDWIKSVMAASFQSGGKNPPGLIDLRLRNRGAVASAQKVEIAAFACLFDVLGEHLAVAALKSPYLIPCPAAGRNFADSIW